MRLWDQTQPNDAHLANEVIKRTPTPTAKPNSQKPKKSPTHRISSLHGFQN